MPAQSPACLQPIRLGTCRTSAAGPAHSTQPKVRSETMLNRLADDMAVRNALSRVGRQLVVGRASAVIADHAVVSGASLIVIGIRGEGIVLNWPWAAPPSRCCAAARARCWWFARNPFRRTGGSPSRRIFRQRRRGRCVPPWRYFRKHNTSRFMPVVRRTRGGCVWPVPRPRMSSVTAAMNWPQPDRTWTPIWRMRTMKLPVEYPASLVTATRRLCCSTNCAEPLRSAGARPARSIGAR